MPLLSGVCNNLTSLVQENQRRVDVEFDAKRCNFQYFTNELKQIYPFMKQKSYESYGACFCQPHWISKKTNPSLDFQTWAPLPIQSVEKMNVGGVWLEGF